MEEHSVIGGLGGAVAEALGELCLVKMLRLGIQDEFGQSGPGAALLEHYGLDSAGIYQRVKAFVSA